MERESTHEQDSRINAAGLQHGEEGHTGYKCSQCATESGVRVAVYHDSSGHYLQKQIGWQEETDKVMQAFDAQVAAHFPNHLPPTPEIGIGGVTKWNHSCQTCPKTPTLPQKPLDPYERLKFTEKSSS